MCYDKNMAKKLRIMDRLLVGLALVDELLDATVGAGSRAYHSRKLGFWTPPNYKGPALAQNIYRLLKTGYLSKEVIKGESVLQISSKGETRLQRNFSFFKMQEKKWDGYWRLVIFDIAEKKSNLRKQLRNKLKELGFGMWQKSIYISPFDFEDDVVEFLKEERLYGMAYVLTAKHRLLGDAKRLANDVWRLGQLNKNYGKLIARIRQSESLTLAKKLNVAKKICYDYIVLLAEDPCLPKELLPLEWQAWETRRLIKRLMA
ncbi:MAG: hypothetical protein UV54_C0034G0006 [Candidatus Beckwithbacteria bacterium GW2011_GWA2_43_10]|uniref:Uncharacterized protein n=1 Tax=Candidatus Beckwithbacteria bacterium GW2011_GWA2_43_10 TaxID=1618369 RepID=A0A0G1C1E4_9BACT|nr:MAG: hypothetical protein UV54_C0034G0006 [Candidatus Beckwithbacteria bacterium GW2011_GWA2_43_10]